MGATQDGDWRQVHKRYSKDMDDLATSFYVTNFPSHVGAKQLWSIGDKYGVVCDVYMASRLSKVGRRFLPPVRFSCKIWEKGATSSRGYGTHSGTQARVHAEAKQKEKKGAPFKPGSGSYAGVLGGDPVMAVDTKRVQESKVIQLQGNEILNSLSIEPSIFAKVRFLNTIPNMLVLLREEGFDDISVKYVGGEWIYIVFESDETYSKFKKSTGIKSLFTILRPVVNGFRVTEMIVWVDIMGLPCCAWNELAIKKLVSTWGHFYFMEEGNDIPLAIKRVCIKTKTLSFIHETIKVMAQGIQYDVMVRELVNWEPNFVDQGISDLPPLSDFESDHDEFPPVSDGGDSDPDVDGKEQEMEHGEIRLEDSEKTYTDKQNRGAGFVDRNGRFYPTSGGNRHVFHHDIGVQYKGAVSGSASRVGIPTVVCADAPVAEHVSVQ
ncbi:hypothetical protein LXL04_009013 [Taraxacum kok-saghyz]